jgi:hypothetical protein
MMPCILVDFRQRLGSSTFLQNVNVYQNTRRDMPDDRGHQSSEQSACVSCDRERRPLTFVPVLLHGDVTHYVWRTTQRLESSLQPPLHIYQFFACFAGVFQLYSW